MKKIIQFIVSFSFISLLFPLNVIAEDFLKAECTNTDDGVTRIQMLPVVDGTYFGTTFLHMKDKVVMQKGGEQTIIDLLSGEVFHEGKKRPIVCKFLNLDVLENKNNEDTEKVEQRKTNNIGATSEDKEVEVIQLLESIEAECTAKNETKLFLIDVEDGKQNIAGTEMNVIFTNNKVVLTPDNGEGEVIIDFESGQLFFNAEKTADCKFSNLEALEKGNTVDVDADEGKIIQLLESIKSQLDKIEAKLDVLNTQENENTVDAITKKEVEIIEATCDAGGEVALFLIRNDGGTQYVDGFGENAEITLTKDKALLRLESSGLMVIDFISGDLFLRGEKKADCEFSNLEALH